MLFSAIIAVYVPNVSHPMRQVTRSVSEHRARETFSSPKHGKGVSPVTVTVHMHVHMLSALRFATYKIFCSFVVQHVHHGNARLYKHDL